MKKFWKYIAACAVVASLMPLTACDDDDTVDPYDINYVYLYQPNSTFAKVEYKANGDFMQAIQDPMKLVPVRLTKPAPADIQVEVAIDPSLVDEYNEANNTDFKFLSGVEILNPTMAIKAGEYITADSITIHFADKSGFTNRDVENLMLPVVIRNGAGLTISKSSRIFLTFNSTYRPNYLTTVTKPVNFKAAIMNDGWQDEVKNLVVENAFMLSYEPYENVTLNLSIDQSKVAVYNEANGTNLKFKSDATLASGKISVATDATKAGFTINTGDLTGLANEESYIIPVTVTSAEGGEIDVNSNAATVYVIVQGVGREMTVSDEKPSNATAISLPTGTACTVNGSPNYNTSTTWIDIIDHSKYQYGYLYVDDEMEIDLGEVIDMASIWVNHWGSYYAAKNVSVKTSADNVNWIDWGTLDIPNLGEYYLNLSMATPTRYIKIVFPTGPSTGRIELDGMRFYVK